MPEEIEVDTDKLQEAIADEAERKSDNLPRVIALSTALFAALAAIVALQAGSTVNEALVFKNEAAIQQAKASDTWTYYQTKGIKAAMARSAREPWLAQDKTPPANLAEEEAHYLAEQRELKVQAMAFEHERDVKSAEADHMLHQHDRLAEAVAFLQVGIALGAVAALTHKRPAWWASLALGLIGGLLFAYAFFGVH
jgi:lipopolysaccharide export LptBFGC system permease protein LptF